MKFKLPVVILGCFAFTCAFANRQVPVLSAQQNAAQITQQMNGNLTDPPVGPSRVAGQEAGTAMPAQAQGQRQSNVFLLQKINSLTAQMNQLRGQLEVQAHDLKLLRDQQKAFYQDLDQRIARQTARQPQAPATQQKAASAPLPVPQALAPAALKPQGEKASYESAFDLIQKRQFVAAINAMQQFLKTFPKSQYAPNAHYWLGELFVTQNETATAVDEFNTVIKQYPDSPKVAPSMLKLGLIYYNQQKFNQARKQLSSVKNKFPDTASARLAKTKLEKMAALD
jgi:tol-pal system protein YbgF